jgi:putative tryptophan/tyrosine transport system substrate-binding protein
MHRRALLLSVSLLAATREAWARSYRVGFISSSTTSRQSPLIQALREGLGARGYEEGGNLEILYRFAQAREQLPAMAADLVAQRAEVIIAAGSEAIVAARSATQTIPIVMTNSGDAVREGFVASLDKPGGNITGMTQISPELVGKRLEMLREVFADLDRVGIVWNPVHPNTPITFREAEVATSRLGLVPVSIEIGAPERIAAGLAAAAAQGVRGFLVIRDPFTVRNAAAIVRALHDLHLLAVFETEDFVEAGGLLSYGADLAELFRQSAAHIDKVLKGARPAELPIQQPTKFALVIHDRVARERGIRLPQSLLARADRVIE